MTTTETTLNELTKLTGIDYWEVVETFKRISDLINSIYKNTLSYEAYPWTETVSKIVFKMFFDSQEIFEILPQDTLKGMFNLLYRPTHYTPIGDAVLDMNKSRNVYVYTLLVSM